MINICTYIFTFDYFTIRINFDLQVILKSVEDLRKNNKVTKDIASTTAHSVDTNSALKGNSKSLDTQVSQLRL